jgi:hypothetical protein
MSTQGKSFILRASAASTAADTEVGDWVDVSDCNELIVALNVTVFAARADETLDVTIERWSPTTTGYTTIATFTQIATTGAHTEEKTVTSLIGGKIRARCVIAGTFSSKSITFDVKGYAKKT